MGIMKHFIHVRRMIKTFSAPVLRNSPKAAFVPFFLNITSFCSDALSLFQFAYPFNIEDFFPVPQILINIIYDAFFASKISTTMVSFHISTDKSPKGLNLENMVNEEEP